MSDKILSESQLGTNQDNTEIDLDAMINATESLTSDIVSQAKEKTKKKKNKKKKKKVKKAAAATEDESQTTLLGEDKNLDSIMVGIEEYLQDDTEGAVEVNIENNEKEAINNATVIESKDQHEEKEQLMEPEPIVATSAIDVERLSEEADELPVDDETTVVSEISKDETKSELKDETLPTLEQTEEQLNAILSEPVTKPKKKKNKKNKKKKKNNKKKDDEQVESKIRNEDEGSQTEVAQETQHATLNGIIPEIKSELANKSETQEDEQPSVKTEAGTEVEITNDDISTESKDNTSETDAEIKLEREKYGSISKLVSETSAKSEDTSIPTDKPSEVKNPDSITAEEDKEIQPVVEEATLEKLDTIDEVEKSVSKVDEPLELHANEDDESLIEKSKNSKETIEVDEDVKPTKVNEKDISLTESKLEENIGDEMNEFDAIEKKQTDKEPSSGDEIPKTEKTLKEEEPIVDERMDEIHTEDMKIEPKTTIEATEIESTAADKGIEIETEESGAKPEEVETEGSGAKPEELETDKEEDESKKSNTVIETESQIKVEEKEESKEQTDLEDKEVEVLANKEVTESTEEVTEEEEDTIEGLSLPDADEEPHLSTGEDIGFKKEIKEETTPPVAAPSSLDDLFAETEALLNDLDYVDDSELAQLLNMGSGKEKNKKEETGVKNEENVIKSSDITKMNEEEPVYLFTSLAGGGFHMIPRTNRLATILQANRIEFTYRDLGTDDEARKVWKTYSHGRMLPAVVRGRDTIVGNWEEMEEFNEDYRIRQAIYEAL